MTLSTSSDAPGGTTGRRPPVDPERWPDVVRLPRASAPRTAVARGLVERGLARMPLRVRHEAGPLRVPRPGAPRDDTPREGTPTLTLHDPEAFHRRIGADGLIGFGESYMAA